jgi:opacity protein-like surface antigen
MNKALIKVLTLTTLLPMATIVGADMKPYIEGQILYVSPDDVDTNTYSGSVSGITFTNLRATEDYETDVTGGIEFGLKGILNDNFRVGLGYSKPSLEIDSVTISGSVTDGVTTLTGPGTFTAADLESVGISADNDAKSYMVNLYYDFDANNSFKPFVGVGLGLTDIDNAEDKELTYAAMAGAKYYFNENAYLGGKFTYASINGPKDKLGIEYDDIDFYTTTLSLGFEF